MSNPTRLTGSNASIQISSTAFQLLAPGLKGVCREMAPQEKPTRGDRMPDLHYDNMMRSLENGEAQLIKSFEIEVASDEFAGAGDATTRSGGLQVRTSQGEAAMVLMTPKPRADMGSAVLYTDENNESRWIFPEISSRPEQFQFHLPRESAVMPEEQQAGTVVRGKITKGIRRIVKVIAWITDKLVGAAATSLAEKWEHKHRAYGFHYVEPGKFGGAVPWDRIREKRSLLLLHGTFSTGQAAFDGLINSDMMQQFTQLYEGRVFAFNHPSMHHTPTQNLENFIQLLPPEAQLEVDVITHSRGGLVGREICQRWDAVNTTNKQLTIRKALFVACPHAGTILTNKEHWVSLIDSYTNLLTSLPDTPFTITMEAIITLVKLIGGGALHGLDGLQSMRPDGDFLRQLNNMPPSDTLYYAMGAKYVPSDEKALVRFGKRLLMKVLSGVFGEDSDMVVPTRGSIAINEPAGALPIPAERSKIYDMDMDINHLNFFENSVVNEQLLEWLREPV